MKTILLSALLMSATLATAADAPKSEKAVFGGGCFWCVEGTFLLVPGVSKVVSGYAGGHVPDPTYKMITTGTTGHAEVVEVTYDPKEVSFKELVDLFWHMHDPTTLNRQGNDVGTQYRSTIMYLDEEQKKAAEESIAAHQAEFDNKIVTEVVPLEKFYVAEDYHQDFVNQNPEQGYVCNVAKPKIEKFKKSLEKIKSRQAVP